MGKYTLNFPGGKEAGVYFSINWEVMP